MLKFLEVSDFHFSPKWADFSIEQGEVVRKAAEENSVDFIALTADFFDHPIYASNKGGIEQAKQIVRDWLSICPVVTVEGTPSHDAPGCYSIFEEMGLVVLRPGKVYGFGAKQVYEKIDGLIPEAILFGVPELNKNNIQARLHLSGEEANAEAIKQFSRYVKEFIAPMRLKYKDIPAIGILHGNVSDSERSNETDIILKASDIVIYSEDLEPACLDRWALGHIHTPWESKKISAGYAGFPGVDKNPWGKRGFKPAFNLVEIGSETSISRLPYSAPERRKVKHSSEILPFDDVAWWIETKDHDDKLPKGLHPWSRITYLEKRSETRRVTHEEAQHVNSLWDLFLLADKDVDLNLKKKVDLITETIKHDPPGKKDVRMTKLKISGCDFFKGKTVTLDFNNVIDSLNQIDGQNGDGKSSLLSFCSMYPNVIGKDTKSGRDSAIKDFFSGEKSMIEKEGYLNGVKHEHIITIKAAHTKNPKTECHLIIDGEPHLDKGSFDEMSKACEDLYGSFEDYRITTFCEQPQQATENLSGLMSAKPIEARNIVQKIAGVDREPEKRFALDKVGEIETQIESDIIKIQALEEELADPKPFEENKINIENQIKNQNVLLSETEQSGNQAKEDLENLRTESSENDERQREKNALGIKSAEAQKLITEKENSIHSLKELADAVDGNKHLISKDDSNLIEIKRVEDIEKHNLDLKTKHLQAISDYNQVFTTVDSDKKNYDRIIEDARKAISIDTITIDRLKKTSSSVKDNRYKISEDDKALIIIKDVESTEADNKENQIKIDSAKSLINSIEKEIALWNTPCEHCGKLSTASESKIKDLAVKLEAQQEIIDNTIIFITESKPSSLAPFVRESILKDIATAESAEQQISDLKDTIDNNEKIVRENLVFIDALVFPDKPADPNYEFVPEKPSKLENRDTVLQDITKGESAAGEIHAINELIETKQQEIKNCTVHIESIIIDNTISDRVKDAETIYDALRTKYSDQSIELQKLKGDLAAVEKSLQDIENQKIKIENLKKAVNTTDLNGWKYIAKMLGADKIPALELDMFLGIIDEEATENIEPFLEGRFAFQTSTQDHSKKNIVDRFDITIIDRQTAGEQSLFTYNPGHKAFFSDAYIKALIKQRNQRMQRSYSPIIFDESDSPIKEDRIPMYYEINRKYFERDNAQVLIVSQKKSAENYMAKVINVNSLKE